MYALADSPSVEVYSIDEAFLDLDRIDVDIDQALEQAAPRIVLEKDVGLTERK